MPVRDYKCNAHHNVLSRELMEKYMHMLPMVYQSAEPMFEVAGILAKSAKSPMVMFPLDYMAEVESMGYSVHGYNDFFGPRGGEPMLQDATELQDLSPMNLSEGRIKQILKAISFAKENKYIPCLNLSGFITATDILLSLRKVCAAWHHRREVINDFWNRFAADLLKYAELSQKAGAQIISYSDPMAACSIIGPKLSKEIAVGHLFPLLKNLQGIPGPGVIHLCGRSSYVLEDAGLITLEEIVLPEPMDYQIAITKQIGKEKSIFGHGCLNNNKKICRLTKIRL